MTSQLCCNFFLFFLRFTADSSNEFFLSAWHRVKGKNTEALCNVFQEEVSVDQVGVLEHLYDQEMKMPSELTQGPPICQRSLPHLTRSLSQNEQRHMGGPIQEKSFLPWSTNQSLVKSGSGTTAASYQS